MSVLCLISCDNPQIPCDERNIAFKACKAFLSRIGEKASADICISKRVPAEAGLGGSSTDGAAVLKGLNTLYGEPLSAGELCTIGAALGADLPFCLTGGTAVCTGIGDICKKIPTPESLFFVIIKPDFAKNTGEAYRLYDSAPLSARQDFAEFAQALEKGSIPTLYNVFQVLYNDSRIESIIAALLEAGAESALMSGSGSAVFGVFRSIGKAEQAYGRLNYREKYIAKAIG